MSYIWNQLNVNTEDDFNTTKRKHEDENSPSKALNMPDDICKHRNKRCTSKGKSSEAI